MSHLYDQHDEHHRTSAGSETEADDESRWDGVVATRDDDIDIDIDIDLSGTFWGTTSDWGSDQRGSGQRRSDQRHTGRVARSSPATGPRTRTRSHRVVPLDGVTPDETAARGVAPGVTARPDVTARLADRLGLGRIDPAVVRIGIVVIVAVIALALALAVRPSSPPPTVTTGASRQPTEQQPSQLLGAASGAATEAPMVSPQVAAAPAAAPEPAVAAPTEAAAAPEQPAVIDPSTLPRAPIINPDAGSEPAVDDRTDDAGVVEQAPVVTVAGAADVSSPASRIVRPCPHQYTIQAGDHWYGLADATGVGLADLLRLNGATVDTPLYPGGELCLPEGAPAPVVETPAPSGPAAPAPAYTWVDQDTAQAVIRQVWPDHLEDEALRIAFRESGFDVMAKNYCCYGLFQIYWQVHDEWLEGLGITTPEHLFDARRNATAALELYNRSGGWGPWT